MFKHEKETWRLKVRVFRSWSFLTFLNPKETNSIEIILLYMFEFSIIKNSFDCDVIYIY